MSQLHSFTLRRYAKLLGGEIVDDSIPFEAPR